MISREKKLLIESQLNRALLLWWLGKYPNRRDGVGLNRFDQSRELGRLSTQLRTVVWFSTKPLYEALIDAEEQENDSLMWTLRQKYDQAVIDAVTAWSNRNPDAEWGYKLVKYHKQFKKYLDQCSVIR